MKRHAYLNYNRLPMKDAYNVRDLGGYATDDGSVTKHHIFLRSDSLDRIDEEDQAFLINYGLGAVIDLRSNSEADEYVNPFRDHDGVDYINLPYITENVLDLRKVQEVGFKAEEFYINLVEYKEMVLQIFHYIIEHIDGCILFHCQAGKDRTGILAMLILGLCGVSREDIISNYEVTYTYLCDNLELRISKGLEELQYSKRQWIDEAYNHVIKTYGSFEEYFIQVGLTREEIDLIRNLTIM